MEVYYGGLSSIDHFVNLGVNYKTRFHFNHAPVLSNEPGQPLIFCFMILSLLRGMRVITINSYVLD